MSALSDLERAAYRLSPSVWSDRELKPRLGLDLDPWQRKLVMSPRGSRTCCLVHRQAGKTTGAAVSTAHTMLFGGKSGAGETTSVCLCPTQRQSSELVRKVRTILAAVGEKLDVDNANSLEANGSRIIALPGSDEASIRGLAVTGDLTIDEAARVSDELYHAARPMLARHAGQARLILASTAWLSSGFFWDAWVNGSDADWVKIEAKPSDTARIQQSFLDAERRALGERAYAREYENRFDSDDSSMFTWDQIDNAFGAVEGPTPPLKPTSGEEDPVVARALAFADDPFKPRGSA